MTTPIQLPLPAMTPKFKSELFRLIEANRSRALWHLAPNYWPETPDEAKRVLKLIAERGDRATWILARQLLAEL